MPTPLLRGDLTLPFLVNVAGEKCDPGQCLIVGDSEHLLGAPGPLPALLGGFNQPGARVEQAEQMWSVCRPACERGRLGFWLHGLRGVCVFTVT